MDLSQDEVKKSILEKLTKKIMDLIVQLLPTITPIILNQFTCSIPKNVTTFHTQSLRELILKNEFVETIDKYPATHTHLGTQKQLTVKSKRSGFRKKWHISIKKNL